jgi:predicted phosphohydrolase
MARISVTSDLHLGITSEAVILGLARAIAAEGPDLTILAGDIGEGLAAFRRCLSLFSMLPGAVGVVAGNHDLWARQGYSQGYTSEQLWSTELPAVTRGAGALWLEEEGWSKDGVGVLGSVAWYDYSACTRSPPWLPASYYAKRKSRVVRDAQMLDRDWDDLAFARRVGAGLVARLAAFDADPAIDAILVATHVPLFKAQRARPPVHVSRASWAYFANLTLGDQVRKSPKVRVVCSGHTHWGAEGVVARPPLAPIELVTLESDYGAPTYRCFEVDRDRR